MNVADELAASALAGGRVSGRQAAVAKATWDAELFRIILLFRQAT